VELKTFVAETLREILEGIQEAQSVEGVGPHVAAESNISSSGHLIHGGTSGTFTRVDFDVAVSGETLGGGRAGIRVFGVGMEGQGEHKTGHASRISFSVHVRLPQGGSAPRRDRPQSAPLTDYDPLGNYRR